MLSTRPGRSEDRGLPSADARCYLNESPVASLARHALALVEAVAPSDQSGTLGRERFVRPGSSRGEAQPQNRRVAALSRSQSVPFEMPDDHVGQRRHLGPQRATLRRFGRTWWPLATSAPQRFCGA
jgi:hypothetical protein